MEDIGGLEDRQRVDRWLEESEYLMGRIIPAYLDDCARVRARLEVAEQDNERLRTELSEARREIAELHGDLEFHRTERASMAESFGAIVEHMAALQKPIDDIARRRLHAVPSMTTGI
jgi:chromosome segregation ATPase